MFCLSLSLFCHTSMNNSFAALVWAISVDGSSLHGWMTLSMSHLLALVAMVLCSQISAYTAQRTHSAFRRECIYVPPTICPQQMGSRLLEVPVKGPLQNENIPAPVRKAPPVKQVPGVWKQPTGAGAWRPSPPQQMQTRAEEVSCTTRLRVPRSKGSFRSRAALAECASAGEKLFGTSAPLRYQEGRDVPSARRVYNATGEAVAQVWREMGIHQLWAVQRSNFGKHGCQGICLMHSNPRCARQLLCGT